MRRKMIRHTGRKHFEEKPEKRASFLKIVFPALFCLSLVLNFYFIFVRKDAEMPLKTANNVEKVTTPGEGPTRGPFKKTAKISSGDFEGEGYQEVNFPGIGRRTVKRLSVSIRGSLSKTLCATLSKKKGCEFLTAYVSRLVSRKFNPYSDLRKGDRLDLLIEGPIASGHNNIVTLRLRGAKAKNLEIFYYEGAAWRTGSYFYADGTEIFPRFRGKEAPIRDFSEITSWVGDFRVNERSHSGVDFKAPVGTPVFAAFSGRVSRVNWNFRNNGDCIEIDHPREGIKSLYLHLNKVIIKAGESVKQGQKIGESGNTGRSFAPHLHYEIRARNHKEKIYDPFKFKFHHSFHKKILPEERESFKAYVETSQRLLNG